MRISTNPKQSLVIGLTALVLALVILRFLPSRPEINFMIGFFTALSIAFIFKYLAAIHKASKK